jgi:arylformamidase
VTEYRASLDAAVSFSNGGDLTVHGFRIDLPARDVDDADDAEIAALDVRGTAVLLHTGDDARLGTPAYSENRHFLTRAGAAWLVTHGATLVGIDALNIDDIDDAELPAHSLLLAAGIPLVEHLTGLSQLPPAGARFTALPLRIEATGTIPVRAFARLPG